MTVDAIVINIRRYFRQNVESAVRLIPKIDDVIHSHRTINLSPAGLLLADNQRIEILTGAIFLGSLKIERDLHRLQLTRIINLDEEPLKPTGGTDGRQYFFVHPWNRKYDFDPPLASILR